MAADIDCVDIDDGIRCRIQGELDLVSEAEALKELTTALERRPGRLIIDLSELEFIDSTGLRVLLTVRNQAAESGTRLLLASPDQPVRRVFEIASVTQLFEYVNDDGGMDGD